MTFDSTLYAGFWRRTAAALIDVLLIVMITYPVLITIYGTAYFDPDRSGIVAGPADLLISWVLPIIATVWFWRRYRGTPGKLVLKARVVDARTGGPLTLTQSAIRYVGYFVSLAPLGLGYIWVAFDARKQAWHDKMAGSVVVTEAGRNDTVG